MIWWLVSWGASRLLVQVAHLLIISHVYEFLYDNSIVLVVIIVSEEHIIYASLLKSSFISVFECSENLMILKLVFTYLFCLTLNLSIHIYKLRLHHSLYWFVLGFFVEISGDNHWTILEFRLEIFTKFETLANPLILEFFLRFEMSLSKYKLLRSILHGCSTHWLLLVTNLLF